MTFLTGLWGIYGGLRARLVDSPTWSPQNHLPARSNRAFVSTSILGHCYKSHIIMPRSPNMPQADQVFPSPRSSGKIPRPRNCFIIFRNEMTRILRVEKKKSSEASLSKEIADMWRMAPPHIVEEYRRKAAMEAEMHRIAYPDYRFQPKPKPSSRKNSATNVEEEKKPRGHPIKPELARPPRTLAEVSYFRREESSSLSDPCDDWEYSPSIYDNHGNADFGWDWPSSGEGVSQYGSHSSSFPNPYDRLQGQTRSNEWRSPSHYLNIADSTSMINGHGHGYGYPSVRDTTTQLPPTESSCHDQSLEELYQAYFRF
ncbi:hypothetical protein D9757_003125 [Collybiopsis confluens]|uniref:HMG box domain-containing protein n=1 Tax=Collybiopsis confluens TaxID=2823264 RepID=A0A8H5HXD5_9AGAR|nr:hypothetical protein D9757_003125 [Collybiopsis confluens]